MRIEFNNVCPVFLCNYGTTYFAKIKKKLQTTEFTLNNN